MLKKHTMATHWRKTAWLLLAANLGGVAHVHAQDVLSVGAGATALHARYAELAPQLARNQFQRPLVIDSTESGKAVSGNAYAVINYPFASVSSAFRDPDTWCEVLILHLNTKHCRAEEDRKPPVLAVSVGKKHSQELKDAHALAFNFRLVSATDDNLAVQLNADKGPLGTHNYRIELRAIPVAGGKTFMHLQYAYGFGVAGRLAMQGYLSTVGSGKIGFSQVETSAGAPRKPVEGMRGAVERNTMRYYLAIDTYMAALGLAPAEQVEKRFQLWFDATERYPKQLHEIDRAAYMTMKRAEYQRQQTGR